MKAIIRQVALAPKKAQLVAGLVRGKKVNEALDLLKFTPKKGAKIILKAIKSASSNAVNNFKQNENDLYISEIYVTAGRVLKRSMPISRGRSHPILKRTSHITVSVSIKEKKELEKPTQTS